MPWLAPVTSTRLPAKSNALTRLSLQPRRGDFRRLDPRFLVADQPEHLLPELAERWQLRHLERALGRKRRADRTSSIRAPAAPKRR